MVGGAPLLKVLAVVGLELTALYDMVTLVRSLSCLAIAWMFVISFRHAGLKSAPRRLYAAERRVGSAVLAEVDLRAD